MFYSFRALPLSRAALLALSLTALALSTLSFAKESAANSTQQIQFDQSTGKQIDLYLETLNEHDLFTGSVLVANGEQVIISKGYGYANAALRVPNSSETTFRVASITKTLTATAVLLLCDQGKLSLDDAISKHLTHLPKEWQPVTVRQLLNHTSGIPSYTDFVDLRSFGITQQTPRSMMAVSAEKPMNFAPGQGSSYNNTAYVMAGLLIETVSGMSYADFMEQVLLRPRGLNNTGYAFNQRVIPNFAQGYTMDGPDILNAQYLDMSVPGAAGALYSTTHDLHRFIRMLAMGKILSAKSTAEMFRSEKHRYGLGIGIDQRSHGKVYSHSGGMPGVNTFMHYEPESDITIIVLANTDATPTDSVTNSISRYLHGEVTQLVHDYHPQKIDKEIDKSLLGLYEGDGIAGQMFVQDGSLYFMPNGDVPTKLFFASADKYFAPLMLGEMFVERDAQNQVVGFRINKGQQILRLKKQPPMDLSKLVILLRGTMNNWGASATMKPQADNKQILVADVSLKAGANQFKFATEDWRTIDFGAANLMNNDIRIAKPRALAVRGSNIRLWIDEPGVYRFTLDLSDQLSPKATVDQVSNNR